MIRVLLTTEIEDVVPLLRAAYGRDALYATRLSHYLAIQPDGWFVAEQRGERVGMVGVVIHETVGYVGLMAVHPSRQRTGLGRALMDHVLAFVRARGATQTMLDASAAGAPLYERCGFADCGLTHDLVHEGQPRHETEEVERARVEDVLDLDRMQFGADRAPTLRVFAASHPDRLVVVREGGEVVAYALAQSTIIGPIVARTAESTRAVLRAALRLPFEAPARVLAPEERGPLLVSEGFRITRSLRHMRLGGPGIAYRVVGKASLAIG